MTKNKQYFILAGFFLLCFFVFFSFLVHKDLFTSLDFNITVVIQDHISRRFDTWFSSLSLLGSLEIVSAILFILIALTKKLKSIFVLFFFGLIHIVELFGKAFVIHPGPPYLLFRYDIPFSFPSSYVQPGSSYPSGHLARTLFISVVIAFLVSRSKRFSKLNQQIIFVLLIIFDIAMFTSRIYLGEHWFSDVVGGSILGAAMGLFSLAIL